MPPEWPKGEDWSDNPQYLGGGGMGVAFCYTRADDEGNIVDRIAVKDCYIPPAHWGHIQHWFGDPYNPARRTHMEIAAMQKIWGRPGSQYCVRLRRSEKDDRRQFYRLYMDVCIHGSLSDVIKLYRPPAPPPRNTRRRANAKQHEAVQDGDRIPEPALWAMLSGLTDACHLLAYGGVERSQFPPGWPEQAVVHRDIKPGNVFLAVNDTPHFPGYPKPCLGDFGMAVMTSEDDEMNPLAYNDMEGTPDWMPPEMMQFVNPTTMQAMDSWLLGEKTNVWGIGAIIIRMMMRDLTSTDQTKHPTYEKGPEDLAPDEAAAAVYSPELVALVSRCCMHVPDERIGLHDLKAEILRRTEGGQEGEDDLAQGLRDKVPDDGSEHILLHQADATTAACGE